MNSTQGILISCLIMIAITSIFVGQLMPSNPFSTDIGDDTKIEAPTVWGVIADTASAVWGMITFDVDGMGIPTWLSVLYWLLLLSGALSLAFAIRGI